MRLLRAVLAFPAVGLALGLGGCAGVASRCCDPCAPDAEGAPPGGRNPWSDAGRAHGRGHAAVWAYLAARYDRDHDRRVTADEHPRGEVVVRRLDRDGDGHLSAADFAEPTRMASYMLALVLERIAVDPPTSTEDVTPPPSDEGPPSEATLTRAVARADRDGSGAVDEPELDAALAVAMRTPVPGVLDLPAGVRPFPFLLEAADRDGSGTLTGAEVLAWRVAVLAQEAAAQPRAAASASPPAGAPPPPGPAAGAAAPPPVPATATPAATSPAPPTAGARRPTAPAVGTLAPDFTLRSRGGATRRTLSDLRGTPVVLVFGSYTCPPFRASAGWIRAAYDRHRDAARFLFVYVREAHAIDGRAPMPEPDQPIVEEPATFEQRRAVADACALDLRFGVFETLVDDLDDAVARAYLAPPARLYVLDREGRVAYRSEPGPFGLRRAEFDAAVDAAVAPAPR